MAKKSVKVDEDRIRGYMAGREPDEVSKDDCAVKNILDEAIIVEEEPIEEVVQEKPKPRKKREESNYRQKYLMNTPLSGRIQVYLNRQLYDQIKNFLPVIAPETSIASYISNIIAEHIELNIEEITQLYKERFSPPKI
ncbi:DUF3408 domain-containing protein [Barnesiella intestinihominis]|uniref:DUF3408 domain-containing protein n=1 Tax=Barnesiella intestinihominis TaxID=487174 RepID=UPI00189809AB|nr:DUF3408 domain-containing protein [Barnesiella intestinihominis]MDB0674538.1 DUF3408 domain-containing protein [Barnesiella intestinihominis]